jgi:hypothetical protein
MSRRYRKSAARTAFWWIFVGLLCAAAFVLGSHYPAHAKRVEDGAKAAAEWMQEKAEAAGDSHNQ